MPTLLTPVINQNKNAFIKWTAGSDFASCPRPLVNLPVLNPADLSFQVSFSGLNSTYKYNGLFDIPFVCDNTDIGAGLMEVKTPFAGTVFPGMPVYGPGIAPGTYVTSFGTGTGGLGSYHLNNNFPPVFGILATEWDRQKLLNDIGPNTGPQTLRTYAARICKNCDAGVIPDSTTEFQWIATLISNTATLVNPVWTYFFQFIGNVAELEAMLINDCFQICIYEVGLYQATEDYSNLADWATNPAIYPNTAIGSVARRLACSVTAFYKIGDECDSYPTSVLQYANITDAFDFLYDVLGGTNPPGINYLESIRLPLYLHSPEYAEEQTSYQKSDGSTLKLVHRIWTDYKFKTDYLDAATLNALTVATAHDYVFITSHYEGLDPWTDGAYETGDATQFVRTEKIETEWQQENTPRFKLGQAKGTIRLALPASTVNSNCY